MAGDQFISLRPMTVVAFMLALAGSWLLLTEPARAERGVALDLGRVGITDRLAPGGRYRLPAFGVRNPGDETARYRMAVSAMTDQERKKPPSEWFRFEPSAFSLGPGGARAVTAHINLPAGADPGDYEALVGPQLVSKGRGAQIGAGAAARVSFTVEPATMLEAYWLELQRFLVANAPLTWLLPSGLALLATGWLFRRRFTLTVARKA